GTELGFLAPLPLACLAPPPAIATPPERWGIRRLGDLARLPVAEVATRLGPVGAALVRAARGEDERPLAPQALGGPVEEAIDLEYALDALEPLLFVLRGLVERVVARVGLEGIGVARLGLALGLEDRSRDERTVPLAAPTRDVKTLLTCLRVELEARQPRCRLVVRALRPPRPVEVFADRGRPDFVRGEGLGGRVVGAAGPWRVVGEWWSDGAFARDYYDLELSDGGIYRCYRDRASG